MTLVIVHYHLRPGGIRRVIELAAPQLVRCSPRCVTRVVLLTGQRADENWHAQFARRLRGVTVEVILEPALNYLSEQSSTPRRSCARIRHTLDLLFADAAAADAVVWAHNLGVGRNLILSRELAAACARRRIPLVSHHHDWWFDNRWARWPRMRRAGFRTLAATAAAVFPSAGRVIHAAINQADAKMLAAHCGCRTVWLPNLTEPAPPLSAPRIRAARIWLRGQLANRDAPVWLLPCRTLRRKNIAEALLLTGWLRPEAWLVVTGAASSAEERPYFRALERAAHRHHWRLRLGVLAGDEARNPSVTELLAVSEVVLLTSVQEGFGLPYLEAAAARRPLIARRLLNIAPDLHRFGFRFPQMYDEILVAPGLFDWFAEVKRQRRLFHSMLDAMPASLGPLVACPYVLASSGPRPVPFSRLTLTAQLEVLSRPAAETWSACASLNPLLAHWRRLAASRKLSTTRWPPQARAWLGGAAYARRFHAALNQASDRAGRVFSPVRLQAALIRRKLGAENSHPILWSART